MQPSRNDPCFCGSGKKFKKCCLPKQEAPPADLLWHRLRNIHNELVHRLSAHAREEFGESCVEEAWEAFWLWDEDCLASDFTEENHQLFGPFFLYNWHREKAGDPSSFAAESRTIAEDYLKVRGPQLSDLERRFIGASIDTPFSYHEVLEVRPQDGFELKDLFLGTSTWVKEKQGSETAQIGDLVFAKVVQIDHVAMVCGCGWVVLPPTRKLDILELKNRIRDSLAWKSEGLSPMALRDYDVDLRMLYLDLQEELLTEPTLTNTDGDLMAFHRITYEISSAQEAFDALKSLSLLISEQEMVENAEFSPSGSLQKVLIDWHKRGNKLHKHLDNTVLGHLEINGTKLTIEVNSAKRAKKIKTEIKKRLGQRAKHLGTVVQSPESMGKERAQYHQPEGGEQKCVKDQEILNDPQVQAQIRTMMESYWENWYGEKIPALGNLTPLQAAQSEDGRELLESLLIEYGRQDEKQGNPLLHAAIPAMRKRLGLPARED